MSISVIIPVYNAEVNLERCLRSVLDQSFTSFEILAINDGSTDESLKILNRYSKKDSRIKVIEQENKGASEARNAGLDISQKEYIFFLDSDDYIHPDTLGILHENIEKNEADCVIYQYREVCESEKINFSDHSLIEYSVIKSNYPFKDFLRKNNGIVSWSPCNKLYRREVIGSLRFFPGIFFEDSLFITMFLSNTKSAVVLPHRYYYYVQSINSVTRSNFTIKKALSYLTIVDELYKEFRGDERFELVKKRISNQFIKLVIKNTYKSAERNKILDVVSPKVLELYRCGAFGYTGVSLRRKYTLFMVLLKQRMKDHNYGVRN